MSLDQIAFTFIDSGLCLSTYQSQPQESGEYLGFLILKYSKNNLMKLIATS